MTVCVYIFRKLEYNETIITTISLGWTINWLWLLFPVSCLKGPRNQHISACTRKTLCTLKYSTYSHICFFIRACNRYNIRKTLRKQTTTRSWYKNNSVDHLFRFLPRQLHQSTETFYLGQECRGKPLCIWSIPEAGQFVNSSDTQHWFSVSIWPVFIMPFKIFNAVFVVRAQS